MGLEIAKIQNEMLQEIANQADENKDGFIRGRTELNLFEDLAQEAVKKNFVPKKDLKTAMNLFEIEYPSENEVLRLLAIESDKDGSEKIAGKELDSYVDKAKQAVDCNLATEESVENSTDGYYQVKTNNQKDIRGAKIVLGIAGGLLLGGFIGRKVAAVLENLMLKQVSITSLSSIGETLFAKRRGISMHSNLTSFGELVKDVAGVGTAVASGAISGVAVAKATETYR